MLALISSAVQSMKRGPEPPVGIALIEVDSFSHFNMSHDPLEGDLLREEIAEFFKNYSRKVDIAARYSGNSFAVIVT